MQSIAGAYQSRIAAVIERAIDDLKGTGPRCGRKEPDRAMEFVLSDDCEAYCLELGVDYETIREKAAGLYRKIIAGEEKPRPGRLSGNRPFRASKMRPVTIDYSSPRGSPKILTSSI
jgi:hypothetical protein